MSERAVYFIRINGRRQWLDTDATSEGRFVTFDSPTEQCDCVQYGIPGDDGGAGILCDDVFGGCDTMHVIEHADGRVFHAHAAHGRQGVAR